VRSAAEKLLGSRHGGEPVTQVSVSDALNYNIEFHVAFALDSNNKPVLFFSPDGSAPIERVLEDFPELIFTRPIGDEGLSTERAKELAYSFGFTDWQAAGDQLKKLYDTFRSSNLRYLEVNPWVQTTSHEVFAVGTRVSQA
jgi:succinyl-CoA synthetase beta subunit